MSVMAATVLEPQGFLTVPLSADEKVTSSNLQHLVSLLSQERVPQTCLPDADVADLKKVITLIGRLGHARYRRPPGGRLSASCSRASSRPFQIPALSVSKDVEPRFSPPLGAAKSESTQGRLPCAPHRMDPDLAFGPCDAVGTAVRDILHGSTTVASDALCVNVLSFNRGCETKMNEQSADGSVYDAAASPILQRHGHARCRGVLSAQKAQNQVCTSALPPLRSSTEPDQAVCEPIKTSSSFISSLSIEGRGGTVSSGKPLFSSALPPLPPKKRKTLEKDEERVKKCHKLGQCHCSEKLRKWHRRTEVRDIAVPSDAMNSEVKVLDDGYSWCIYGQKVLEGSTYPRVYYKCSSVRGCPARKHVQVNSEDKEILTVTYGRRHVHP